MNTLRNEIEEKGWQSIDSLIQLMDEVVTKMSKVVDVTEIERYIRPQMATIYRHAYQEGNDVQM